MKYLPFGFFVILFLQGEAQNGIWLSQQSQSMNQPIIHSHVIEIGGWWQPQSKNSSEGFSYSYQPYFTLSKSALRVKGGLYFSEKVSNVAEIPLMMILPGSPTMEISTGFSKLFPQTSSTTYYEMAFNVDVTYGYRKITVSDVHKNATLSTYNLRSGFEIIPIPKVLSFYGNGDILLGVSGSGKFQNDVGIAPLQRAEYFDAGVKAAVKLIGKCKDVSISSIADFNLLFTEKRIRELTGNGDAVIPNLKLSLVFSFPRNRKS